MSNIINIIHLPNDPKYPHREEREKSVIEQMEMEGCEYKMCSGFLMNPAKTGISRAHKSIILYAKSGGFPEVCIAEDDLKFTGTGAWKYFIENKPTDFDIYVGGYYSGSHDENLVVSGFRGMTLYICHSRFYDKFLSLPENMHIDGALAMSGAKIVVCNKFVCKQAPGWSEQRKRWAENEIKGKEFYSS